MSGILSVMLGDNAAAAAAGSVWGDHGTNSVLSTTTIANDTVTGLASSVSTVRGTQAYSTGKHYFEVKVLTAPVTPIFNFGLMDNTTANGAAMDADLLANSVGNNIFNGNQASNGWNGTNLGGAVSLADNDVLGFALDSTNEFYYVSLNTVWYLSGDPTSGATGTGAVGNGGMPGARPMLTVWGASNGIYQLITGSNINPAHIPSGYTAWA